MNLLVISGLSGSGKSVALNTLEDIGYYCIDNLPVALLRAFAVEFGKLKQHTNSNAAVGIDARNHPDQLDQFPDIIHELGSMGIKCKILFLRADEETLLKRFSETRRRHPLTNADTALADAIAGEQKLLAPIAANADLSIDTSHTNIHQLGELVRECIGGHEETGLQLVLKSFGYKHGTPSDADFIFDTRCLPNPHWEPGLRALTGKDPEVIAFLEKEPDVQKLREQVENFLATWIPKFSKENRSYLNIAIGCTGGQHRSVYLVEQLARSLGEQFGNIVVRHREL